MIAADGIERRSGGLKGISLRAGPGAVTAVIGPNGAGKSTLLEVLAGRKRADKGVITIDGRRLEEWSALALARRRAFVPQASDIAFDVSTRDIVALGRAPYQGEAAADTARAIDWALQATRTATFAGRLFNRLSGGEKQRVGIARALAQIWRPAGTGDQRLLILDEPTASLDPGHRLGIMHLLRDLAADGICILLALHDLNDAARYADQVLLLKEGRLLAAGQPLQVIVPAGLRDAFAADAELLTAADGAPVILFR